MGIGTWVGMGCLGWPSLAVNAAAVFVLNRDGVKAVLR